MGDKDDDINDPLFEQFNSVDADKVELEMASKPVADMFKAFRANGLSILESAVLTCQLTMGGFHNGENQRDSQS